MMCCPFHGDKHPSMKVDNRFHCFACQADGDVIDFVGRLFQLSPYKAVEKLKEDFGMALADGKVRLAPRRPPTVNAESTANSSASKPKLRYKPTTFAL